MLSYLILPYIRLLYIIWSYIVLF